MNIEIMVGAGASLRGSRNHRPAILKYGVKCRQPTFGRTIARYTVSTFPRGLR